MFGLRLCLCMRTGYLNMLMALMLLVLLYWLLNRYMPYVSDFLSQLHPAEGAEHTQ